MSTHDKFWQTAVSRRWVLEVVGMSLVSGGTPLWAEVIRNSQLVEGTNIDKETTPDGDLVRAWFRKGSSTVQVSMNRKAAAEGTYGDILFTQDHSTLLKMTGELLLRPDNPSSDQMNLGQASIAAQGNGINYSLLLDAHGVYLDPRGFPPKARGRVEIRDSSKVWNGTFDFNTWKPIGLEQAPSLDSVLPKELKVQLAPFLPTLNMQIVHYKSKSQGAFSPERNRRPVFNLQAMHEEREPQEVRLIKIAYPSMGSNLIASIKGSLCRAGCWGLGGAGGAIGCVGTGGLGCVGAIGLLGGLASLCSDSCPP